MMFSILYQRHLTGKNVCTSTGILLSIRTLVVFGGSGGGMVGTESSSSTLTFLSQTSYSCDVCAPPVKSHTLGENVDKEYHRYLKNGKPTIISFIKLTIEIHNNWYIRFKSFKLKVMFTCTCSVLTSEYPEVTRVIGLPKMKHTFKKRIVLVISLSFKKAELLLKVLL